jgi:hypothetical protein
MEYRSKTWTPWLVVILRGKIVLRHYAKRMCPISYAFGAWRGTELIGVVTYGTPVSSSLRSGICGSEGKSQKYEINEPITTQTAFLLG